ncbi:fasciclin domain-containing protein [Herbidospora sp. RD11066]
MKKTFLLAMATAAIAATSACGAGTAGTAAEAPSEAPASTPAAAPAEPMAAAPFGPACAAVPADGEGSFTGMADDPVATAASNNPVLSTLVTAVKKAGLVDTLNSAKDITVFAPTNDAFAAIPKGQLDKVLADKETLTKILTYHVVSGRLAPSSLPGATPATLQGGSLAVTGAGEDFTVNEAKIVCGGVQTGNATVYIIDKVLMPM